MTSSLLPAGMGNPLRIEKTEPLPSRVTADSTGSQTTDFTSLIDQYSQKSALAGNISEQETPAVNDSSKVEKYLEPEQVELESMPVGSPLPKSVDEGGNLIPLGNIGAGVTNIAEKLSENSRIGGLLGLPLNHELSEGLNEGLSEALSDELAYDRGLVVPSKQGTQAVVGSIVKSVPVDFFGQSLPSELSSGHNVVTSNLGAAALPVIDKAATAIQTMSPVNAQPTEVVGLSSALSFFTDSKSVLLAQSQKGFNEFELSGLGHGVKGFNSGSSVSGLEASYGALSTPGHLAPTLPLLTQSLDSIALVYTQPGMPSTSGEAQVAQKIQWMLHGKQSQAEIRLDPPELGSLHIQLNSREEGTNVSFVVQNASARELIEQNIARLREFMEQSGVELGDISVFDQSAGSAQADQNKDETDTHSVPRSEGGGEDASLETDAQFISSSLLDEYV